MTEDTAKKLRLITAQYRARRDQNDAMIREVMLEMLEAAPESVLSLYDWIVNCDPEDLREASEFNLKMVKKLAGIMFENVLASAAERLAEERLA